MANNGKNKNINISPIKLSDVITKESKYCYFIESQYQRPFVWTLNVILNDFINVVYSFLLKRKEDEYHEYKYGTIGTSPIQEVNEKYCADNFADFVLSILDGGHRIRLFMCLYIVLLVLKYSKEGKEYINIDEYIKIKNGEYKLDGLGLLKDDFKGFYSYINSTKINEILKPKDKSLKADKIRKLFMVDSDTCEKSMREVFYFLLYSLQGLYSEDGVDILPEEVDYDFSINAILKGIILYDEEVPYDEKWEFFRNRNGRGMPLADKYLYSRQLINAIQNNDLREKVNLLFIGFDKKCKALEKEREFLKEYKDVMTFIMSEIYKLILYKNKIIKYTDKKQNIFSNSKIGLNIVQCKYNVLIDGKDIEEFFVLCDNFADFLSDPLGKIHSSLCKTNYLFYDFSRKTNVVTWHLIATSVFLLRKYYFDEEHEKVIFNYLLHYMLLYYMCNYLLPGSNVSWFRNGISKLNNSLYTNRNSNFNEVKIKIAESLKMDFDLIDKSQLIEVLNSSCTLGVSVDGKGKDQKGGYPIAIRIIMLYFEAFIIDKLGITGNNGLNDFFSKLYNNGKSDYDLDHIFTKKKYNENIKEYDNRIPFDNNFDKSKLGNFVFLESNLNRTKSDDESKNTDVYSQSSFYSTKLLNISNKCDLSNDKLLLIPFKRYDEKTINNPSIGFVEERTRDISNCFVNWVFSTYEDFKKILDNKKDSTIVAEDDKKVTTEVVYSDSF